VHEQLNLSAFKIQKAVQLARKFWIKINSTIIQQQRKIQTSAL